MAQQGLFINNRTIYWPSEFADIVNMFKGLDGTGQTSHSAMYKFNTGVIVLASIIGLIHNRERDVGSQRQEISTDSFESHKIGNSSLAAFVLLVPVIGAQDIELLRPERESDLVKKFERYAAGGFEYIRGLLSQSSDTTGMEIIKSEIKSAYKFYQDKLDVKNVQI